MKELLTIARDERGIATVTLNRPDVHNAFNEDLIAGLTEAFESLGGDGSVYAVVLAAEGPSFSAGADLNWMRSMAEASEDENRQDALRLARMYRTLNELPQPVVGRINGAAFGGGVGLVACCDIAIGAEDAKFGLTEVKLGLIPATIAPFVLDAIGRRQARRLFLNAEIFDGWEARRIGLLHDAVPAESLDKTVERHLHFILKGGPRAVVAAKGFIRALGTPRSPEAEDQLTAELIARLRVSDEGQEGLAAFLDKRKPRWAE